MFLFNDRPMKYIVEAMYLNSCLRYNGKFSHLIGFNATFEKRHLDKKLNKYRAPNIWYNRKNKYNRIIKKWKVKDD